ncbi:hypothetical protein [Dissulfurimicrobium hydrothermale]|uniref:hypothetical protein n=1 Tax=Dissulfurimicrobium hydrothermale TaxID=1750598 RepID=UPI001ED9CBFF|nr:hypothetical protein [Dissulfurimicrobium hydrothermale]UKL13638.1 hypothetical protein LGS26_09270 [Dissulfurimicrobium hydrothermale]
MSLKMLPIAKKSMPYGLALTMATYAAASPVLSLPLAHVDTDKVEKERRYRQMEMNTSNPTRIDEVIDSKDDC